MVADSFKALLHFFASISLKTSFAFAKSLEFNISDFFCGFKTALYVIGFFLG